MKRLLAALTTILLCGPANADTPYGSDELIAKAKAEGRIVLYSVNFNETEQAWIIAFNKRFPFVKVELVRAPGGQMITRIRTEAAAGKLVADVIDYSDRGHLRTMGDLYQEYAPPNAADFKPEAVTRLAHTNRPIPEPDSPYRRRLPAGATLGREIPLVRGLAAE